MNAHDVFWKLETLSDRQLFERLGSVLGSSRRLMAELVAPEMSSRAQLRHLTQHQNAFVLGVTPAYFDVRALPVASGVGISDDDEQRRSRVVIPAAEG